MRVKFFDGNITTDCERGSLQQYILNQECKHKPKVFAIENECRQYIEFKHKWTHIIPVDHGECFPMDTKSSQAAIMYPCYMVDYVIKLDVENNLYIFKEKESKI
ncbi:hypothetical protein IGI04_015776 [Brassica rapa subsp. trilocularis]|uniref:Uncharacterized protein n=2 Tax=Brassica TaxID=3705 RepID=A0ABQ8DJC2_BRANA|nr:hypothetical protein IGI04_015776 [Brassica rapa subsp. trilocularis]KAH0929487.1 hypothetical protein HID58_015214 [Brassica napus]